MSVAFILFHFFILGFIYFLCYSTLNTVWNQKWKTLFLIFKKWLLTKNEYYRIEQTKEQTWGILFQNIWPHIQAPAIKQRGIQVRSHTNIQWCRSPQLRHNKFREAFVFSLIGEICSLIRWYKNHLCKFMPTEDGHWLTALYCICCAQQQEAWDEHNDWLRTFKGGFHSSAFSSLYSNINKFPFCWLPGRIHTHTHTPLYTFACVHTYIYIYRHI